mmetsp:Transcript_10712/g.21093  ORF Transcript_10712/g.21093 Transcript_10712/m.21093 type:complete len:115 (+) Transcript_10712:377-721(+)
MQTKTISRANLLLANHPSATRSSPRIINHRSRSECAPKSQAMSDTNKAKQKSFQHEIPGHLQPSLAISARRRGRRVMQCNRISIPQRMHFNNYSILADRSSFIHQAYISAINSF